MSTWAFAHDVMFYEFWPVQFPVLLFGGSALGERKYVELWKRLDTDPTNEEVIRNMPVRQSVLWGRGVIPGRGFCIGGGRLPSVGTSLAISFLALLKAVNAYGEIS
ncbi:MAG TPA: hypothetical protein VM008_10425 [Phycisphaerae bacterium]|nr:hypothetical protein [Phycisphaerae bacterium]